MSARFLIQFKELSTEMLTNHVDLVMREKSTYLIPHRKVTMKSLNIGLGGTCSTFDKLFKGILIDCIAIAMVADAAASSSYSANPFKFQTFALNYSALSANSQQIPRIPLEPNFTTKTI